MYELKQIDFVLITHNHTTLRTNITYKIEKQWQLYIPSQNRCILHSTTCAPLIVIRINACTYFVIHTTHIGFNSIHPFYVQQIIHSPNFKITDMPPKPTPSHFPPDLSHLNQPRPFLVHLRQPFSCYLIEDGHHSPAPNHFRLSTKNTTQVTSRWLNS